MDASNQISPNHGSVDKQELSWNGGSIILRTVRGESSQDYFGPQISIGILLSAERGSRVSWNVDGRPALDRTWKHTFKSHDLVLLPPGCEIQDQFLGIGQGLWMLMDPATFADNKSLRTFVERPIVDASWRADPLSRQIISEVQMECVEGFPRGPMFLERAANVFVSQLAHILTSLQNSRREGAGALDDVRLFRVLDFLRDNLHRNITLSELANLVGFTPRYFCAAFKEATGQSPHQFQIEQRIERAKIMLRDPSPPSPMLPMRLVFAARAIYTVSSLVRQASRPCATGRKSALCPG